MNIPEKSRLFLPFLSLLWVCSFIPANAQNWQEFYALNEGNYLEWQRTVLSNPYVIQHPDPAVGSINVQRTGSLLTITFIPAPGAEGTAEFIIEYLQGPIPPTLKVEAFRVFVSTSFVNAQKDFLSLVENSVDNILDVLSNDDNLGSDELKVSHIAAVKNGSAQISADEASVIFTPDADFVGMAYLTYVACDEFGSCDKAEVSICVVPAGPPALIDTILLSTHSRAPVVAVLPMDDFTISNQPGHGFLTSLSANSWEYTPHQSFSGTDQFVLVKDVYTRYIIIDVYYKPAPNSYVNPDMVFTRIDEPVTFDVLANDVKKYPVNGFTEPDKGILEFISEGVFNYIPEAGYEGAQIFEYTTCFLAQCETGSVVIYVGDMIPENVATYHLVTTRDVPLVLNYEIPLDGYAFTINALPDDGTLSVHSGHQSIEVLCSVVEGYDLITYTPSGGFTGNDYFEIYYCIDGGACHLVKVDIEVRDEENSPCACVERCVWPGDADANGQVTLRDFLSIGWQIGFTGPARNYPDNNAWMGQSATAWGTSIWDVDSKYADSDGDGVITTADVGAISAYYLRKHTLVPKVTGLKADYTFNIIPLTPEVDSGDMAVFEISIGTENDPVIDMHGIAFSLNLPVDLVDTNTIEMTFYDESWLSHDASTFQMDMQPWGGRLDAAFTRTTGRPASGVGGIGILVCVIEDDIEGFKTPDGRIPVHVGINGVNSMSSSGLLYNVEGNDAVIYINRKGTQAHVPLEEQVFVFPNPAADAFLNVHVNGQRTLREIEVIDMSGASVGAYRGLTTKQYSPDISGLENGLYLLRVTTSDGVVTKKFEVMR